MRNLSPGAEFQSFSRRVIAVAFAVFPAVARDHVFADRVLHEVLGRNDTHLPRLDVLLVHDAAHAAVVVDVRVAVNHGEDRLLAGRLRGRQSQQHQSEGKREILKRSFHGCRSFLH